MNTTNNGLATNNMVSNMMRWQLSATAAVAVLALLLSGMHACFSAFAGGLSVLVGAYIASRILARNEGNQEPSSVLITLLKAEAVKIVVVAALLFVIFKMYTQLVPFALIAGLAAAAIFSGAALAKTDKSI